MAERKTTYRKGVTLMHKETKEKILFGKWLSEDRASCISLKNQLLTLTRADLDTQYVSLAAVEKAARDKRKGQAWK